MANTAATGRVQPAWIPKPLTVPVTGTALLLIDVINDLVFEGSSSLVAQAEPMASRLAVLKRRASAAGVPAIYINDNVGQWRSDFRSTVAHCTSRRFIPRDGPPPPRVRDRRTRSTQALSHALE
jgi:nicotinamidase-related amidase